MKNVITTHKNEAVQNFPIINKLFNRPLAGLLWLPVRVWLGYQWLTAGLHKLETPGWIQTGVALKGFWTAAVAIPATGTPAKRIRGDCFGAKSASLFSLVKTTRDTSGKNRP